MVVRIEPDSGSFTTSSDTEVIVKGYQVFGSGGDVLGHSDEGEVAEGVFCFRIAGATHHRAADELDGETVVEVLLRHRPDNPKDPNAIEILSMHGMKVIGFVPAKLAPKMIPVLLTITVDGETTVGTMGLVVKTFDARRSGGRWRGSNGREGLRTPSHEVSSRAREPQAAEPTAASPCERRTPRPSALQPGVARPAWRSHRRR